MARQKRNLQNGKLLLAVLLNRLGFHAKKGRVLMRGLEHCSSPEVTAM